METRKPIITTTTESKIIKKKQHQILHTTTQMTMYLPEEIDLTESVTTAENRVIGKKIAGY